MDGAFSTVGSGLSARGVGLSSVEPKVAQVAGVNPAAAPKAAAAKDRIITITPAQGHISREDATKRFDDAQACFTLVSHFGARSPADGHL